MTRPALRIVRDQDASTAPIGQRIRHALVCLDRSAASEVCLSHAQTVADAFGAELTLTHVLPSAQPGGDFGSRTDALEWEIARRESDQYLDRARLLLESRVASPVRTLVTQGMPADRIALSVRETSADLVIVAGHSLGTHAGPIGATVQRLLELTRASLLVAHGSTSVPPRHIVVPLDGSPRTESVLPSVLALARTYDAIVTLVHVVPERTGSSVLSRPSDLLLSQQLTERLVESAEEYLLRICTRELRDLSDVRRVVRSRTDERRAIVDLAAELGADLIVFAAHGAMCEGNDAFGGVASYLLAHARIPMLVLQDVAAPAEASDLGGPARRPSGIRRKEDA